MVDHGLEYDGYGGNHSFWLAERGEASSARGHFLDRIMGTNGHGTVTG